MIIKPPICTGDCLDERPLKKGKFDLFVIINERCKEMESGSISPLHSDIWKDVAPTGFIKNASPIQIAMLEFRLGISKDSDALLSEKEAAVGQETNNLNLDPSTSSITQIINDTFDNELDEKVISDDILRNIHPSATKATVPHDMDHFFEDIENLKFKNPDSDDIITAANEEGDTGLSGEGRLDEDDESIVDSVLTNNGLSLEDDEVNEEEDEVT